MPLQKSVLMERICRSIVIVLAVFSSFCLEAMVRMPAHYSDNMVLQQKSEVLLKGFSDRESVAVVTGWDRKEYRAEVGEDGSWSVRVTTPKGSRKAYDIDIYDGNGTVDYAEKAFVLNNVLIGEVWLCSGQSNMEMPLAGWGKIKDYGKEIQEADKPYIRLLQIKRTVSRVPEQEPQVTGGGWNVCSPASVPEFSAVAYLFARNIYDALGIPVGVIDCTWGGSRIDAWMSWRPSFRALDGKPGFLPGELYNAMLYPLSSLTLKGVLWYQGENNVGEGAYAYECLFPTMIQEWRELFHSPELPFYYVQLANFHERQDVEQCSGWAALREAQAEALHLDGTRMAVAIDIGDADDCHFKNKQEVARRLSLCALEHSYGKRLVSAAPSLAGYRISGSELRLSFDTGKAGFAAGPDCMKGFVLAGADGEFHKADARWEKDEIVLSSPEVKVPVAARYAWADNPRCNVYGLNGLPLAPFRTDRWPLEERFMEQACVPEEVSPSEFVRIDGRKLFMPDGQELVIRGTNLGNWLNPEGYMFLFSDPAVSAHLIDEMFCQLVGPDFTAGFWRKFKDNYITEDDIRFLKEVGANTVRLPLHYKLFTEQSYLGAHGEQDGFERIDSLVGWCRKYGIYVILDMHDAPGGQTGEHIDDSYGYPWLFESEESQKLYCDIWRKIASRYRNEPVILGYELLNEPIGWHFRHLYDRLEPTYKRVASVIREVDTNHIILLGGANYNDDFSMLNDYGFDPKMMYTCHRYGSDYIENFLQFRKKSGLPMYMGEAGHGKTYEWQEDFFRKLRDNDIGYTAWPYKKMSGWDSFVGVRIPEGWDQIQKFATAPRNSYEQIRNARKDVDLEKVKNAMMEFAEGCRFSNCEVFDGYIRSVGLKND